LNAETHPDIFTHSHELQLSSGKWYFHRTGNSFKGGNYKGLDITFSSQGYGGILIRALRLSNRSNEYVDGPCKVVDKILELTGFKTIAECSNAKEFSSDVFKKNLFYLEKREVECGQIYHSARIGLKLRNQKQIPYVMKPYRFMKYPKSVKKGRQHLVLELHHDGYKSEEIQSITGCSLRQCEKWTNYYNIGFLGKGNLEEFFDLTLKVDEFSVFYGLMKQ
jgi:3-methyladenine DNA glycosylase Mpg